MEGKLIIPIEADISQFKAAFAEANKIVSDFNAQLGRTGSTSNLFSDNSIGVLITRINELETQLVKLKKQFDDLKTSGTNSLNSIASASTKANNAAPNKNNQISDPAAKAKQSLTALSLVAQDLPFGFIAIQNNLPNLLQYFGELRTQAKESGGSLKYLKEALIGTAGVYLAFSITTALITKAVKEYGSLGNAIDVLFGKNSALVRSQNEYNKSLKESQSDLGGEIAELTLLSKIISSNTATRTEKLNAVALANKIQPELLTGIVQENALTADSTNLIVQNAKARIEYLKLKGQESAINKALDKTYEDGLITQDELTKAIEKRTIAQRTLDKIGRIPESDRTSIQKSIFTEAERVIGQYEIAVKKAREANQDVIDTQSEWYKKLEPILAKLGGFQKRTDDLSRILAEYRKQLKEGTKENNDFYYSLVQIENYKPKEEKLTSIQRLTNLQNYANIILNVSKSEQERSKALESANKENYNFFESFKIGTTSIGVFKNALNSMAATLEEAIIQEDLYNKSVKNLIQPFDVLKMRQEERVKLLKEEKKLVGGFNYKLPEITPPNVKFNEILSFEIQLKAEKFFEDLEKTKKKLEETNNFLSDIFFRPLEDAFTQLFETGRFNIQQLGNAVVSSLKQTVSKILATGIIATLATLVTGGFGGPGGVTKGIKTVGGIIASSLGFSSGKVSAPDFGGMQGGGMQLAGEVVFVQRGSDLVGVINRTNGTINRVG